MANRRFELFEYRHILVRMRRGDSDRDIARRRLMGRAKLAALRQEAQSRGWLDPAQPMPEDAEIASVLSSVPRAIASRDQQSKHSSPIVFIESGLEPLVLYADLGGFVSAQ